MKTAHDGAGHQTIDDQERDPHAPGGPTPHPLVPQPPTSPRGRPAVADPFPLPVAISRRAAPDLAGDQKLVAWIREHGCTGPVWEHVAAELDAYARPVLWSWILSTRIFAECWQKGVHIDPTRLRRVRPANPPWNDQDAEDLASETIIRGLLRFQVVLAQGRWQPGRGARLTTYFLGQCLFHFPNVYLRWLRDNIPLVLVGDATLAHRIDASTTVDDPAEIVIRRDEITRALAGIPDQRTRQVLELAAIGYSLADIAGKLDTTPKAINGVLYRYRRGLKRAAGHGSG